MDIKKENKMHAEIFVESYGHNTPETKEEFEAILACFGEMSAHYALEWAANWIKNSVSANDDLRTKEFAANMVMTIRSVGDITR